MVKGNRGFRPLSSAKGGDHLGKVDAEAGGRASSRPFTLPADCKERRGDDVRRVNQEKAEIF